MFGKFGLGAVAFAMLTLPAFAQGTCGQDPIAPEPINGKTATEAQLIGASHDAHDFMKTSDDFQTCLDNDLKQQKREAAKAKDPKPLDPSIEQGINARVDANQRLKEKVGAEFHAALLNYCQRPDANSADCKSVPQTH